jgi:hypothetical protein
VLSDRNPIVFFVLLCGNKLSMEIAAAAIILARRKRRRNQKLALSKTPRLSANTFVLWMRINPHGLIVWRFH